MSRHQYARLRRLGLHHIREMRRMAREGDLQGDAVHHLKEAQRVLAGDRRAYIASAAALVILSACGGGGDAYDGHEASQPVSCHQSECRQ